MPHAILFAKFIIIIIIYSCGNQLTNSSNLVHQFLLQGLVLWLEHLDFSLKVVVTLVGLVCSWSASSFLEGWGLGVRMWGRDDAVTGVIVSLFGQFTLKNWKVFTECSSWPLLLRNGRLRSTFVVFVSKVLAARVSVTCIFQHVQLGVKLFILFSDQLVETSHLLKFCL